MPQITLQGAGSINILAFLDLIAFSEGTSTSPITQDRGYDVIVSGVDGLHRMVDYDTHPFDNRPPIVVNHAGLESTAAGRYQLLHRYWTAYKSQLSLPDFSPLSQDKIAIQQLKEAGAMVYIVGNQIETAVSKAAHLWASFPGNNYGQGGKSIADLLSKYTELLRMVE